MYIWMMLAAFIVMLAAFNLSPRADLQRQQQMPLAEASITKFLVQHDAAVKYTKSKLAAYHSNPTENAGLSAGMLSGCNDENNGDLCNFLPIGYKYEENLYYSGIYCVNAAEYTNTYNPETGETTSNKTKNEGVEAATTCNGSASVVYVITFGRVPERWKNASTHRILGEYFNAMHSKIAVGSSCGIVVPKSGLNDIEGGGILVEEITEENGVEILKKSGGRNPLDSDYVIAGIDVQNASIPSYFLNNDSKFNSKCDKEIGGEFPCIIYVTAI